MLSRLHCYACNQHVCSSRRSRGPYWPELFANSTSVELHGKTSIPSANGKFCSTLSGKLECKITDWEHRKPDYYLLRCDRNRGSCTGTMAVILPTGHPWLTEIEYRVTDLTDEHVLAVLDSIHPCVVTTLHIDLISKEAPNHGNLYEKRGVVSYVHT
jgi:hypothetical protein